MKKLITILLIAAMLVPVMTFTAEAVEIENLYKASEAKMGIPSSSTLDGAFSNNANYFGSNAVAVKEGDVVTFGPVFVDQSYYLTAYKANGSCKIQKVTYADCTEVAVLKNNARIVKWTVPSDVAYIRMATSQMFRDSTVITVNNEFTPEEYFACMKKAGTNVDYLLGTAAVGSLDNKFPKTMKVFAGRTDVSGGEIASASYTSSDYIPVKDGDVLYFAAAVLSQGYHLTLYDANKKGTTNVNSKYMVLTEDIGRGYGIYSYKMRPGTAYVRIIAATGVWNDEITLATLNQPFNGDDYRAFFNITVSDKPTRESVLCGKTALFMGDSISYGAGDTLSYITPGRAWAGRIGSWTGLDVTNASVSGSKVSFLRGDDKAKWHFTQFENNKGGSFDMVVIQGGVNDARHERAVGDILDVDTSESKLEKEIDTYAGGLQWLFHNVKKTWPDAKLFFIANHRLNGHSTGNAKNMAPYFDKARELCELYGFVFIDLYNNEELESKLQTDTTKYLPDTLHLNAAGYEIITPYILEALEAEFTPETVETTAEEITTAAPTETSGEATDSTAAGTDPTGGGCGSAVNGLGVIAVITLAATAVSKKRK